MFNVPAPAPSPAQLAPQSAQSASQPDMIRDDPSVSFRAGPLWVSHAPFLQDQPAQSTPLPNSDVDMSTDGSAQQGRAPTDIFQFASDQSSPSPSLTGVGANRPQQAEFTSFHFNSTLSQSNTSRASPSLFSLGQSLEQPSASLGSESLFAPKSHQQNGTSAGNSIFNSNLTPDQENALPVGTYLFGQNSNQHNSMPATSSLFSETLGQQTSTQPNLSFSSQPQQQSNIPNPSVQVSNQESSTQRTSMFFNQPRKPQSCNLFSFPSATSSQPVNNIFAHLGTPQPQILQSQTSQHQNAQQQKSQSVPNPPNSDILSSSREDTFSANAQSRNAPNSIFTTMNTPQQQSISPKTNSILNNVTNLAPFAEAASNPSTPLMSEQNSNQANVNGLQKQSTLPNTLGGHSVQLVSDTAAPLTESSTANMQQHFSTQVPNGIHGSTDISTSNQPSIITPNSTEFKTAKEEIEALVPPSIPVGLTAAEEQRYVYRYRIRMINEGFTAYMIKNTAETQFFSIDAFRWYEAQKHAIVAASDLFEAMSGGKRKSTSDGLINDASLGNKRVNVNGTVPNGGVTNDSLFQSVAVNNKRKADEDISKEADVNGLSGTAKKARGDSVTYPSLTSTQTSETASLFQSIANNNNIDLMQNDIQHDPVNGRNGSTGLPKPALPQPTPESSIGGNEIRPIATTVKPIQSTQLFTSSLGSNTATTATPSAASPAPIFNSTAAPSTMKPADPEVNKPKTSSSTTMGPGVSSGFSLPKFSTSSVNFMAQFGQAAKKTEKEEKAKRKAETFDSDEEDEAEWERKDEEEQRAKRQKIEEANEAALAGGIKFVPGPITDGPAQAQHSQPPMPQFKPIPAASSSLFSAIPQTPKPQAVMPHFKPNVSTTGGLFGASGPATSIFSRSTVNNANGPVSQMDNDNIFGYLSAQGSDAEGSKTGDADNEESDEDEQGKSPIQPDSAAATGGVVPSVAVSDATFPVAAASKTAAPGSAASGEAVNSSSPSGVSTPRSLFDRIETNADGTFRREVPPSEKEKDNSHALNSLFSNKAKNALNTSWSGGGPSVFSQVPASQKSASNLFGSTSSDGTSALFNSALGSSAKAGSTATLFGQAAGGPALFTGLQSSSQNTDATKDTSSTSYQFDNTWKVDSPIKFGGTNNAPSVNVTAPSPSKPPVAGPKPASFTNLFGSVKPDGQSHTSQPQSNLFGTPPITSTGGSVGFQFGATPTPSLFASLAPTSALNSAATSRATSPGASTGAESANEGNEDNAPPDAQIDLVNTRVGEEDEDILFEVKAKALEYDRDPAKVENDKPSPPEEWLLRGVGSLRVLKHRNTGKTRMILRAGPGGKIILNTALMSGTNYKLARDKSVMFMAATKAGTLAKWTITVGKKDDATRLAGILEQNKSN